jgi:hypothetical protein
MKAQATSAAFQDPTMLAQAENPRHSPDRCHEHFGEYRRRHERLGEDRRARVEIEARIRGRTYSGVPSSAWRAASQYACVS